jgi:hypothetical protein
MAETFPTAATPEESTVVTERRRLVQAAFATLVPEQREVFDMLGPEETQAVAEHFQTGCPPCAEELRNVERVVGLLGFNTPAVRPQHLAVEELFVLAGDCHVDAGHVLLAGDYFRAAAGSVHGTTFTETGTTFLTLYWNTFPA